MDALTREWQAMVLRLLMSANADMEDTLVLDLGVELLDRLKYDADKTNELQKAMMQALEDEDNRQKPEKGSLILDSISNP